MTITTEKIPLRYGYAEHLGVYEIKAYLTAKMKAGPGSSTVKNTEADRKSWQQIHRTHSKTTHQRKLKELTNTGNYTLNQ